MLGLAQGAGSCCNPSVSTMMTTCDLWMSASEISWAENCWAVSYRGTALFGSTFPEFDGQTYDGMLSLEDSRFFAPLTAKMVSFSCDCRL